MTTSQNGIDFIKSNEALRLHAYLDSKGKPTIGYGCVIYRNGNKVKMGDTITVPQAEELLLWQVGLKETGVNKLIHPYTLSQNRFDAIVDFAYNLGIGALGSSTLLKKIRKDPEDASIEHEFLRWNKVHLEDGTVKESDGLTRRRIKEIKMWFL